VLFSALLFVKYWLLAGGLLVQLSRAWGQPLAASPKPSGLLAQAGEALEPALEGWRGLAPRLKGGALLGCCLAGVGAGWLPGWLAGLLAGNGLLLAWFWREQLRERLGGLLDK
jgi:hypothetical protein